MKLAVVSGGSKGLGAALCEHYRQAGWRVIDFSRSGHGRDHVAVDLGSPVESAAAMAHALQAVEQDGLDELVAISNAARLGPIGPTRRLAATDLLGNVLVNSGGGMVFMASVLRVFADAACEKTLVNISSGAARRAIHGWSAYCAAKAGLERFVECVALEQEGMRHPFRTISISPGVVDTGMQEEIRDAAPDDFPDHARFVELKREGRLRTARETAVEVARIISDRPANGGRFEAFG